MPSVSKRGGTWYIKFKDGHGRWTRRACTAENKADAKRLAAELAHQHERQRHGLGGVPRSAPAKATRTPPG
jgi:hypothetical protein